MCERGTDTKGGRGQMSVPGLVSYYVPLRLSAYPRTSCFIHPWFICFGPRSHTLHHTAHAARSSSHSCTCWGQDCEITNVFIQQDGSRLICCFRKQYAIDSFLACFIYQGNTTWPWALNQHHPLKCIVLYNPMNMVMCVVMSPVVMSMWVSVSVCCKRSHPRWALTHRPARQPSGLLSHPALPPPHLSQNRHTVQHQPNSQQVTSYDQGEKAKRVVCDSSWRKDAQGCPAGNNPCLALSWWQEQPSVLIMRRPCLLFYPRRLNN